jgi:hypothetical protein
MSKFNEVFNSVTSSKKNVIKEDVANDKLALIMQLINDDKEIIQSRREKIENYLKVYSQYKYKDLQNIKLKISELMRNPKFAFEISKVLSRMQGVHPKFLEDLEDVRESFFQYIEDSTNNNIIRTNVVRKIKEAFVNASDEEIDTFMSIENDLRSLVLKHVV